MLQGLRVCFLFSSQEELGTTIAQLVHAFQTMEARKYHTEARPGPVDTRAAGIKIKGMRRHHPAKSLCFPMVLGDQFETVI